MSGPEEIRSPRPPRPFVMPDSLGGKLRVWRYIILRRATQLGILALFIGTFHWGWTLAGRPVLAGNLSGSELLGLLPMADPFAVLQILSTGSPVATTALLGAALVLVFYGLVGGRVWCSWACPVNMVTDLAAWLRDRLGVRDMFRLSRNVRYGALALALVLSVLTGWPPSSGSARSPCFTAS